ncbi:serine/threonine-protein kinase Nek3 [Sceloporus undulatus]|uniref:serine/threonine-protein kinase Nek3 n=1 Tax=Sceloporus undulatus TaxID=8520 RepID=UPI001C4B904B|nr:serine/threonine-protein kinase Nek3 [Sceloporus undulatus]XP_042302692.1 serine/threonine-protein kinase Nek3 [Sceloporus undulatus]XP_042302694.1 serine/threonine-protein kinase Nek3 [Sceloporus undulatus]XP_042302695.1 serine/threonine-protein kinase Nek3 [Sceloporus undulatus]XP_042302696.1 serine/threonine-protein kinase Nek3 [Sceloporus undulatus]XP_042302697.1 serine/threonine-protein kinase Nek3 [Sceloporus undulatus]XP_042302698.1 serine/threonine-protein kinase Nek3 [Sceloporus u
MEKYSVLKILGEGSYGRVLLVHHRNRGQKYAMKEIRLPKSIHDAEKSWNESILLAKMKHPNIVTFTESFEDDGHLYIVMEYCDDGDLMQKIKLQKGKLFLEDTILDWFTQMCLGVKYIHDKRVLHRDIKSKNVFLTQHGKVKLGDFGSALLLTSPMAYACSYMGTPYYVPPEIWENMPYNNKSDIWSLGCILYELCTLKHPFQSNSWKNLILKICKGYYSPLPSHYTYELQYLIKQMFRKDPKNRPSASTILAGNCLAKRMIRFSSEEEEGKYIRNESSYPEALAVSKSSCEVGSVKTAVDKKGADLRKPQRRQWETGRSTTLMNILENAPLLSSSITTKEETSNSDSDDCKIRRSAVRSPSSVPSLQWEGGCERKYDENIVRKQWSKEPPETLLNILHNADISLAFKTYTIYKAASDDLLKGPLTEDTEASDEPDGDIIMEDTERLEPRSDDEDTDFEAEDDPDWVAELKRMTKMK